MEKAHKTYFDYLDALRCLAFLAVFYAHTGAIFSGANLANSSILNIWTKFTIYGSYGVNFFFVLSGFLITYLLLKERSATGTISIKNFYIKRVLRIWPVYFMTFFFAALILPFLISSETYSIFTFTDPRMSLETLTYFFFFLGNFYQGLDIGFGALSIGILWSVCVEEQFYLVWPWVVKFFNTRRLIFITVFLIALSLLYKFIFAEHRTANYYLPWSVGMDLAFGALLGIYYFNRKNKQIIIYSLSILTACGLLIAGVVGATAASGFNLDTFKSSLITIIRLVKTPIIDCIFTLILLYFINKTASLASNRPHPILNFFHQSRKKVEGLLTYLGKISYGLYAYHTICLMLAVQFLYASGFLSRDVSVAKFFLTNLFAFILTIITAHLSSVFIEKKILTLRDRLK